MITAQDIRAKTFEKAVFGGYEMSSVDDYLEGVAQELESQAKEISVLKGKLKILADKVEEYRSTEEAMRQALVSAQQMASQIEEDAKSKSEAIITDATAQSLEALAEIKQQVSTEEGRAGDVRPFPQRCPRVMRAPDPLPGRRPSGGGRSYAQNRPNTRKRAGANYRTRTGRRRF